MQLEEVTEWMKSISSFWLEIDWSWVGNTHNFDCSRVESPKSLVLDPFGFQVLAIFRKAWAKVPDTDWAPHPSLIVDDLCMRLWEHTVRLSLDCPRIESHTILQPWRRWELNGFNFYRLMQTAAKKVHVRTRSNSATSADPSSYHMVCTYVCYFDSWDFSDFVVTPSESSSLESEKTEHVKL